MPLVAVCACCHWSPRQLPTGVLLWAVLYVVGPAVCLHERLDWDVWACAPSAQCRAAAAAAAPPLAKRLPEAASSLGRHVGHDEVGRACWEALQGRLHGAGRHFKRAWTAAALASARALAQAGTVLHSAAVRVSCLPPSWCADGSSSLRSSAESPLNFSRCSQLTGGAALLPWRPAAAPRRQPAAWPPAAASTSAQASTRASAVTAENTPSLRRSQAAGMGDTPEARDVRRPQVGEGHEWR